MRRTPEERFSQKVKVGDGDDPCWLWQGKLDRYGYGWFWLDGKDVLAHRQAWRMTGNELDSAICVLHKCDVRNCVRAQHLFTGTRLDNTTDMVLKGRGRVGTIPYAEKIGSRYRARLRRSKGKRVMVGTFNTAEAASSAAIVARDTLYTTGTVLPPIYESLPEQPCAGCCRPFSPRKVGMRFCRPSCRRLGRASSRQ
jgi:hypothetical protein